MHSDNWLKSGFKHSSPIKVTEVVDYYFWTNGENRITGVTVNFEYADDCHYELLFGEWMKFQTKVLKSDNLDETKELFKMFLDDNIEKFAFQNVLDLHEIKYDKVAFY